MVIDEAMMRMVARRDNGVLFLLFAKALFAFSILYLFLLLRCSLADD